MEIPSVYYDEVIRLTVDLLGLKLELNRTCPSWETFMRLSLGGGMRE
jgi:hypothetical protein